MLPAETPPETTPATARVHAAMALKLEEAAEVTVVRADPSATAAVTEETAEEAVASPEEAADCTVCRVAEERREEPSLEAPFRAHEAPSAM